MPKLPIVTPSKLIRVISKLGFFRYSKGRGSHIVMAHIDGRKIVIPMHSKDIPTGTLLAMLKDIQLSKQEFVDLLKK